ncbi:hypothetical protein H2200_009484 [Cladophialophora chaetospira]|uniref:BHLH domain-containing protein n=1 Tax=Cladophialophora chaetospira TaxID=386627 RepID=A0AA38X2Q7_9EURO|nr:hypothetical protein H2200_009484 [Cladophialophora chaetospira]
MEVGPQLSWNACFNPDQYALSTASFLPYSNVALAVDSLSSDSSNYCDESARSLALEAPTDGSSLSVSSDSYEHGFGTFLDEKGAPVEPDIFPKFAGLTPTTSAASTASSPHPFQRHRQDLGGVSRLHQSRTSLFKSAIVREQTHDDKVRRERPTTSSRRSSSDVDRKAKAAHSVVERRYRDKLNDTMMQLHLTLASSKLMAPALGESFAPGDLPQVGGKIGKAVIMTTAINYVNQAELQLRHMSNEIEELRSRVMHLEALLPHEGGSFRNGLLVGF